VYSHTFIQYFKTSKRESEPAILILCSNIKIVVSNLHLIKYRASVKRKRIRLYVYSVLTRHVRGEGVRRGSVHGRGGVRRGQWKRKGLEWVSGRGSR
jgi:hypothetical protein